LDKETSNVTDSKQMWAWLNADLSYKGTTIPFTDINGPIQIVSCGLQAFFFNEVTDITMTKMKCYATS